MFYTEDSSDSGDDGFMIEKEYASYEGILLQSRNYNNNDNQDEIPIAVESKDIEYVDLYKPHTVFIEVKYVNSKNIKVGTGHGMGYAIDKKNVITSKHLFHLKQADEKNFHARYDGIVISHIDNEKNETFYLGKVKYEPKNNIKNVFENILADANDFIIIEIIGNQEHSIPLVHPFIITNFDQRNKKYSILIGGPAPQKGGWAKKLLSGAKLIAETKRMPQLPTVHSIKNAFPEDEIFTCAKIDEWNVTSAQFITYQKSTLKSWSGAPGLLLENDNKNEEISKIVRKDGKPIIVLFHAGELSGQNLTYGLTPVLCDI